MLGLFRRPKTSTTRATVNGMPARVWKTVERFDERAGFREYTARCRAACVNPVVATHAPFLEKGFERLDVFSARKAASLLARIKRHMDKIEYRRGEDHKALLRIDDDAFFDEILATLFDQRLDACLREYFGSEYVPYMYGVECAPVSTSRKRSFLWHCDKGPSRWCKVLIYFTGSRETGGDSYFVDRETSDAIARTGYTFCSTTARLGDLGALAEKNAIAFRPQAAGLRAGQALLFEPSRILHKGEVPTKAPRYMMQLWILPSPVNWREGLDRLRRANLPEAADFAFPSHASRLWDALS